MTREGSISPISLIREPSHNYLAKDHTINRAKSHRALSLISNLQASINKKITIRYDDALLMEGELQSDTSRF